jgi:SAM-dependent methyltransferase
MAEIVNGEQAAAWNGVAGVHWATYSDYYDGGTRLMRDRLLKAVSVSAGERILDVGCGTGATARAVARTAGSGGYVLGADLSAPMLEKAQRLASAEGLDNIEFERADAQVHPFKVAGFDKVISSFGVMFFSDRQAAFENLGRALRPGGELAVIVWRALADNPWVTLQMDAMAMGRELPAPPAGAPSPFAMADEAEVLQMLEAAGFVDVAGEDVDELIFLGKGPEDAEACLTLPGGPVHAFMTDLDEAGKAEARRRLRAMLAEHQTSEGVGLPTGARIWTARRG